MAHSTAGSQGDNNRNRTMTNSAKSGKEELLNRVEQAYEVIWEALLGLHTRIDITDSEIMLALTWTMNQLAVSQAYRYYGIDEKEIDALND